MNSPRSSLHVIAVTVGLLSGFVAAPGRADPAAPVAVELPPAGVGEAFVPGVRTVAGLPRVYVEDEYFVSGQADLFSYAHNPPLGPTDLMPIQQDVPYATRMIVRRPEMASEFNGTVVIEWWNTSANFDTAPAWDASAEYFARSGTIYVGVTNSDQGLSFLVGGCSLLGVLPPTCGTRYAALSLPDDGLAYEMMSQIANLLKGASDQNPLPDGFAVERVFHVGQSQQGGSMITYASSFHSDVNDGYFVQQAATARAINGGPACGSPGSFPFPFCRPVLQGSDRRVRTDLPVPVYHVNSETDLEILFGTAARQDDTGTFRYFEVAGAGHLTVHEGVEIIPAGVFGPDPVLLSDLCLNPINSTADGPIFLSYVLNALWDAMEQQVRFGRTPPAGVWLDTDPVTGAVLRDPYGNGRGGVRLPAMDVPTATYTPGNVADPSLPGALQAIGNLACFLASSVTPFDQATLDALYPTHGRYVNQVVRAAADLGRQGLLLPADAHAIRMAALTSSLFCGIGFELVLVLPPLMWLRARRRR